MTDFSRIITSAPVNATAARQTGRGVEWTPRIKQMNWHDTRPAMRPIPAEPKRSGLTDLTGQRHGRLTVIGLAEKRGSDGRARWVCRCQCGCYCLQSAKSFRDFDGEFMCGRCGYQNKLRDGTLKGMRNDGKAKGGTSL